MPSIFAVTLQMPRGNIETIYPRALVLAGIRKYIDKKKYRAAYLACRSHMVDMNILYDYAPAQFMGNVPLFVEQLKRVEFIDEFLSHLRLVIWYGLTGERNLTLATEMKMFLKPCTKTPSKQPVKRDSHRTRMAWYTTMVKQAQAPTRIKSTESVTPSCLFLVLRLIQIFETWLLHMYANRHQTWKPDFNLLLDYEVSHLSLVA